MAWIDSIIEGDRRVHKKQRHTAHRIFERLRWVYRRLHDRAEYVAQALLPFRRPQLAVGAIDLVNRNRSARRLPGRYDQGDCQPEAPWRCPSQPWAISPVSDV